VERTAVFGALVVGTVGAVLLVTTPLRRVRGKIFWRLS